MSGAGDRLEKALKFVHGGEHLTNVEVVEAVEIIQQCT